MHKSKLIQALSLFSKQELKRFSDFVHSPYFNKHQNTKELLDYILEATSWDSHLLDKHKAFAKLFPDAPFEEQRIRTLLSYLVQLLHQFYGQLQTEKFPDRLQIQTLEKALTSDQQKMFEQLSSRWNRVRTKNQYRDSEYFLQNARFYRLQDTYDLTFGKRIGGEALGKAIDNFDTYYISEKYRMVCEMLARKQVTGQEYEFVLLEAFNQHLLNNEAHFKQIPSVWLYYLIYKMMSEGKDTYFFELKTRLKSDALQFKQAEGRDLYTHALNFCIGQLNFGAISFKREIFDIYQQMLASGFLYIDGELPQWDYTNIVSTGCDLGEGAWVKTFIFEQKEFLPVGVKENTFTYNLAAFHYSEQHFSEAQMLLQKVVFTDVYYNLLSRILLLKIYFETKDWNALDYLLETFRIYLLRNKQIGTARQKSGLNLIKYSKKVLRLIEKQSLITRKEQMVLKAKLLSKIEKDDKVISKSWLLGELQKL